MSATQTTWTESNQTFLVAEFNRLKMRFGFKPEEHSEDASPTAPSALESPAAIDWLSGAFGLSLFERDLLLLCAGVEMDTRLAALCADAHGNPQRSYVTFGLAMAVLPDPHWSALTPTRPLRRFRLVEPQPGHGLTSAPLRIDERILHLLAGINTIDGRLAGLLRAAVAPEWATREHQLLAARVLRCLNNDPVSVPVFHFCGDDPQGQEDIAGLAARKAGRQLFVLRAEDIPPVGPELEQLQILWQRESLLLPGALLIQCNNETGSPQLRHFVERLSGIAFLTSREPVRVDRPYLRFDLNKPDAAQQKALWKKALGRSAGSMNGTLDTIATQFRLSARTILSTRRLVVRQNRSLQPNELWETCRSLSRPRLADLAQRITPAAGWNDLVLPETPKRTLHQIVSQVRWRMKVYQTWGFAAKGNRGLGVSTLFTGESGTGKTMAAEVLARELQLDLYRIDLATVVSKYIGETEKNLKQVFDAAEEGGAILLFDEADALFGKRSDVKDSHDRYANIEVGYLLQRMEAYQGLAILTTNLKSSIDRSFQRRIRFFVTFPFPEPLQRETIWSRVFPAHTPARGLDHKRLSQLNMTGGNIRNIALNAAFLAAGEETESPIEMKHLLQAARLEAEKMERPLAEAETRGWI